MPARRRDSVVHRPLPMESLPPPATLHPFVLQPDSKHFLPLSALYAAARRSRLRPSFVGLLALLALSAFCLLHQHLNDAALSFPTTPPPPPPPSPRDQPWHRTLASKPPRPKIALAPPQELAAVVSFIAALPSNALADTVDPARPIDPDLVLDFDTRTPAAAREVLHLVDDTWARLPVVLLSKRYSPVAREIKHFLSEFNLQPAPAIFDIDERADAPVLTPLLYRLTNASDLPILLVAGQPLDSLAKIRELHTSGELRSLIAASGAIIDGDKKKKKKGRRAVVS